LTVEKSHETLVSRINRIKEMPASSRLVESMQKKLERVNMSTTTLNLFIEPPPNFHIQR
jgi:hypothetical protein